MGLDMYLMGERYSSRFHHDKNHGLVRLEPKLAEGFPVDYDSIDLGSWRRHPSLHEYIVNEFADGKDDCQKIRLSLQDLEAILEAVKSDNLPNIERFFLGDYDPRQKKKEAIDILERAIAWLTEPCFEDRKTEEGKTVKVPLEKRAYYQASW